MAKKKSFSIGASLQQALGDTVSAAKNHSGELHIEVIPLRKIELDPENPREMLLTLDDVRYGLTTTDESYTQKKREYDSLQTIALSIKNQGVINPIFVYKQGENYRLITGERRTMASILAQKNDIQAKVLDKRPEQLKLSLLQWIENMERADLTLWERLRNLDKIINAYAKEQKKTSSNITATEISVLVGCSLQQALNYKNVMDGSPEVHELIQNNQIKNLEKAALIAKAPATVRAVLIKNCLKGVTLKNLKILMNEKKIPQKISNIKDGRGRQATRVNFGSTANLKVAKIIINLVLENEKFKHLSDKILPTQCQDYKSVSETFKALIKVIEKFETEEIEN